MNRTVQAKPTVVYFFILFTKSNRKVPYPNLSRKMKGCISDEFIKLSIVQSLLKCFVYGANN